MNSILCPHCHQQIDVDEAVSHQAEAKISAQFQKEKQHLEEIQHNLQKRLAEQIENQKTELETTLAEHEQKIKKEVWEKAQLEAQKRAEESSSKKIIEFEQRIKESEERTQSAEKAELEMRKKQRELEQEKAQFQLKLERSVDERMKVEAEKISKTESEKFSDKERQLQKQIEDLKKMAEEATRKASTVSQQLQGEVMELQIEQLLRDSFPGDFIEEVKKGQLGADILQTVKNSYGKSVGIIVWESKQTLVFQEKWLSKLREDVRASGGTIAVLVTRTLPDGITTCAERDHVWITGIDFVLPLAQLLRQTLVKVDLEKTSQNGKDVKAEMLYQYINSQEFIGNVEGVVESFRELKDDLDREKTAMQNIWKKREKQILRLATHAAHMYGGVQGIVGNSLPGIQGLDLDTTPAPIQIEDGTKEQNGLF